MTVITFQEHNSITQKTTGCRQYSTEKDLTREEVEQWLQQRINRAKIYDTISASAYMGINETRKHKDQYFTAIKKQS